MILFPNAKINLGLHVLSRRMDDYHNIETLMVETGFCDILEFQRSADVKTELNLSGRPVRGENEENSVIKVWEILHEKHSIPAVKIHLHKVIPPGAGLGGGSSDAAFMLSGLNEFFQLKLTNSRLKQYASLAGSDCSFFIDNKPALVCGKGDILTPSPKFIEGQWLCIFYPGFEVSTVDAYSGIILSGHNENLIDIIFMKISDWRENLVNDFESTVFIKYPMIAEMKQKVYESGAIYASMSGSGSSVFGIYPGKPVLNDELKKWLVWEENIPGR